MIRGLGEYPLPGGTGVTVVGESPERGMSMKVSVYKGPDGELSVLLQASPGRGRAPVVLSNIDRARIKELVGPEIDKMRAEEPSVPLS